MIEPPIEHDGLIFNSISELSRYTRVPLTTLWKRLKSATTVSEAIATRPHRLAQPVVVAGTEFESYTEAGRHFGIAKSVVLMRKLYGWSPEEIFGLKPRKNIGPGGWIYRIRQKSTGKEYYGSTKYRKPEERYKKHIEDALSDARVNPLGLCHAIRVYGIDDFEFTVILACLSGQALSDFEIQFIRDNDSLIPNGFNIRKGGRGYGDQHGRTRPVVVNGVQYASLRQASEAYPQVDYYVAAGRLLNEWTPDEAFGVVPRVRAIKRGLPVVLRGLSYKSLKHAHEALQPPIEYSTVMKRREAGWSDEDAFFKVLDPDEWESPTARPITVKGIQYATVRDAIHAVRPSLSEDKIYLQLRNGLTADEAFDGITKKKRQRRFSAEEILDIRTNELSNADNARRYGVDPSTISRARDGKRYKDLDTGLVGRQTQLELPIA
jgi:hypothetical protein